MPRGANSSRNWCFTLNNYTENNERDIRRIECNYIIYGRERAPETGTRHLQGYVRFANAKSMARLQALIPGAHFERAMGSAEQNKEYCSKEGDFEERGDMPVGGGKRTDLDNVRELVRKGASIAQIADEVKSYQALKFAERYKDLITPTETREVDVRWYWGATGTGKTHTAFTEFPDAWMSSGGLKWWDGYCGQRAVIFDDFRADHCSYARLLRLLDKWPVRLFVCLCSQRCALLTISQVRVEVKGSTVQLLATTIIITTPDRPEGMEPHTGGEDITQLLRRITTIREFTTPYTPQ